MKTFLEFIGGIARYSYAVLFEKNPRLSDYFNIPGQKDMDEMFETDSKNFRVGAVIMGIIFIALKFGVFDRLFGFTQY